MRFILSFLIGITHLSGIAQETDKVYIGISSDSTIKSHFLSFLSDSTVELSSIPRHHSIVIRDTVLFDRKMDTLLVLSKIRLLAVDCLKLVRDGRALIDSCNELVYVRRSDFDNYFDFLYVIDGTRFIQRTGIPDSYGVVKRQFKKNKRLTTKLDELALTIDQYSLKFLRGYQAYRKYGYRYSYGVIELFHK